MNIYEYAMYRQARIRASQLLHGEKLTIGELHNAQVLFALTKKADDQSGRQIEDWVIEKIYKAEKILAERMRGRVR